MKKTIRVILIIIGILLIFYPVIGKFVSKLGQTSAIEKYKEKIIQMDDEEKENIRKRYEIYDTSNIGELLGYIEIEKINLYLPIYDGTTDKILLKGVGHLENTPLPTLKNSYHSVLVGHTGITANTIFDDLVDLELGDKFSITILDEVFNYRICDIKTILPTEIDSLIQNVGDNRGFVTLVTCTPKYINSHRLLVIGENI